MRVFLGKSQDSENMQSIWTYSKAGYLRLRLFMISSPSPVFFSFSSETNWLSKLGQQA